MERKIFISKCTGRLYPDISLYAILMCGSLAVDLQENVFAKALQWHPKFLNVSDIPIPQNLIRRAHE
jgi:hypothetical protein